MSERPKMLFINKGSTFKITCRLPRDAKIAFPIIVFDDFNFPDEVKLFEINDPILRLNFIMDVNESIKDSPDGSIIIRFECINCNPCKHECYPGDCNFRIYLPNDKFASTFKDSDIMEIF